jgi:hypothetical protein
MGGRMKRSLVSRKSFFNNESFVNPEVILIFNYLTELLNGNREVAKSLEFQLPPDFWMFPIWKYENKTENRKAYMSDCTVSIIRYPTPLGLVLSYLMFIDDSEHDRFTLIYDALDVLPIEILHQHGLHWHHNRSSRVSVLSKAHMSFRVYGNAARLATFYFRKLFALDVTNPESLKLIFSYLNLQGESFKIIPIINAFRLLDVPHMAVDILNFFKRIVAESPISLTDLSSCSSLGIVIKPAFFYKCFVALMVLLDKIDEISEVYSSYTDNEPGTLRSHLDLFLVELAKIEPSFILGAPWVKSRMGAHYDVFEYYSKVPKDVALVDPKYRKGSAIQWGKLFPRLHTYCQGLPSSINDKYKKVVAPSIYTAFVSMASMFSSGAPSAAKHDAKNSYQEAAEAASGSASGVGLGIAALTFGDDDEKDKPEKRDAKRSYQEAAKAGPGPFESFEMSVFSSEGPDEDDSASASGYSDSANAEPADTLRHRNVKK